MPGCSAALRAALSARGTSRGSARQQHLHTCIAHVSLHCRPCNLTPGASQRKHPSTHTQPLPQAQWGQNTCLSGSPYALQTGLALTLGFSCTPTNMTGSAVVRALQRNASTAAVLCCAAEHPLQPATKYKPTRQCVRRKTRASVSWRASTAKGSLQPQRRSPLTPSTSLKYEVSHKQAD